MENSKPKSDANTTAYCEACQQLPEAVIAEISRRTGQRCQATATSNWRWKGRNIKFADGTTMTMSDTVENQSEYPQQRGQKRGHKQGRRDQIVANHHPALRSV
ncbi:MAG: hypothetical protein WBD20_23945 [Pirellulaceae bacterium]